MNKDSSHFLKKQINSFSEYVDMPVRSNGEKLIPIPKTDHLRVRQIDPRMTPFTGDQIYVRETVLESLIRAKKILQSKNPALALEVVYGFRTLKIQRELFEEMKKKLATENEELVHHYIAAPVVAGHPTGGAVDIQILKNDAPLDFGTKIWEFVEDSFVFSPCINKTAWQNRQLLRDIMTQAGFAPYDGEWWHFSYGDKEWANYYGKPFALYEQLDEQSEPQGLGK